MRPFFILAALFLSACATSGGGGGNNGGSPSGPTLDPTKWNFRYGENFGGHPTAAPGGGFTFIFPVAPNEVDYLTTDVNMAPPTVHAKITLKVEAVTGTPRFVAHNDNSVPCSGPASVRIMLEQKNDSALTDPYGRWWARAGGYILVPGSATIDISLTDLHGWTSVFGAVAEDHPAAFRAAMANLGKVGITAGGCGSYGHGVWTENGTARMTITEFIVQ